MINFQKYSQIKYFNKLSNGFIDNKRFNLFLLIIVGFAYWLTQIKFLELYLSSIGSSPFHYVNVILDPLLNKIDWPTGTRNLGKSLPINIYRLFENNNLYLLNFMKAYMLFEVYLLLFAHYYFFTTLIKKDLPILALIFTAIVSLSTFQYMNLARFGFPYIWGLYYSIAAALNVIGLSLVIKNKPWSAAIIFFLNIATHPIVALFGILSSSIIVILRGFETIKKFIIPAIFFSIFSVFWFVLNFSNTEIISEAIPKEDWISLSKIFQSHWYPFSNGVFAQRSEHHFLPTISVMLLYVITWSKMKNENFILFKEINIIVICLSIITVLGLMISYYEVSPFLIKLSLHRASSPLVVAALVPVIYFLWTEFISGSIIQKSLAIMILLSPFIEYAHRGFYLSLSILFSSIYLLHSIKETKLINLILPIFSFVLALVIFLAAIFNGYHKNIFPTNFPFWLFLSLIIILSLLNFSRLKLILLIGYICIAIPTMNFDKNFKRFENKKKLSMYQLQRWTKENTNKLDLIMLNPNYYGGWRDISERASFGTVKEWLHNAWLYDSNLKLYQEGVRRFSLLGLTPQNYYSLNRNQALKQIRIDTEKSYYNKKNQWFKNMSDKENIKYFVFEKKNMKKNRYNLHCPYENKHYVICKLKN
ncbi:hypothetical protein OAS53_00290 [Candidatus Pelagibacter ubique]|nr:hypothetical protein [Candidatus Pelagibacter ubique]